MRCYVFIQTTKLHIFSIYGNFLLFIFYFLKDMRTEEQVFLKDIRTEEQVFFERHKNRRTCFIPQPQPKNMFFCSSVLSSQAIPCSHVLLSYPRKQSPCSSVLLSYHSQAIPMFFCSPVLSSQAISMFSCLITMHIFLIPIKILNCFSLPFQISFILLYINILSLRKIENSIYTFYRNGTSTL